MSFEFAMRTCRSCQESKIAIISFSLTNRNCRDCVKEAAKKKLRNECDVMKTPWKGKSWGSRATEMGQALNANQFDRTRPPKKLRYFSPEAFA